MSHSLNEIEALARKAARGAGMAWGLAEEAGKATRWLCAAGLRGADCLAWQLQRIDKQSYFFLCPQDIRAKKWQATGIGLCPLATGPTLSDRAERLVDGVKLEMTSHPLLLYPYMAGAADAIDTPLWMSWEGVTLTRSKGVTFVDAADEEDLIVSRADPVLIGRASGEFGERMPRGYRAEIKAKTLAILTEFAARTYAPETEESRLAGAGAGLTDND